MILEVYNCSFSEVGFNAAKEQILFSVAKVRSKHLMLSSNISDTSIKIL